MTIYCTPNFCKQIAELAKNKSYASVLADVCDYFKDKNIHELHITKAVIRTSPSIYSINKYRIINSLSNKGKSSSYRCICGCYVKNDLIILDTIYPKTGSEGIDNLSKEQYTNIATSIKDAVSVNDLAILDIGNQQITKPAANKKGPHF